MNSMKILFLLAHGLLIASIGYTLYDQYKVEPETPDPEIPEPLEEPKEEESVELPPVHYGNTLTGRRCILHIISTGKVSNPQSSNDPRSSTTFSVADFVAKRDAFVRRHLYNKSEEIECFFDVDTDRYMLTKYSKTEELGDVEMKFRFDLIEMTSKDNSTCLTVKYTIKLKGGRHWYNRQCRRAPATTDASNSVQGKDVLQPMGQAIFILVGGCLIIPSVMFIVRMIIDALDGFPADENIPEADLKTKIPEQEEKSSEIEAENTETSQPCESNEDDSVDEQTETASQVDHEEMEVFSVPVVEKVDSEKEDCNQLVGEMIDGVGNENELASSDMEMSSEDGFEHVK